MKTSRISPALQSDWKDFLSNQDYTDVARVIVWFEQNINAYENIDELEELACVSDFKEDTLVKWFDEEVLGNAFFTQLSKSIFFCQREFTKSNASDKTLETMIDKSALEDYAERWAHRNSYKKG